MYGDVGKHLRSRNKVKLAKIKSFTTAKCFASPGFEPMHSHRRRFLVHRPNHSATLSGYQQGTFKDIQRDKTVFCPVTVAGGPF